MRRYNNFSMVKILFAACGSIGHIAPCIAVWRAVQKIEPTAQSHVVCSTRQEDQTFLQKEDMTFTALGGRRLSVWTLPMMLQRAWRLLGDVKPDVIFTKGGGVTIPVALAGWIRRIPIVVHESDAVPGRATRFISKFAAVSINGFREGNPLRPGIHDGSREKGLALTGLSGSRPILLVTGGSQGAQIFNETIKRHIDELLRSVDIIHITGEGKGGVEQKMSGYWKSAFVHEDLHHLYAIADLALGRAGSGTIGELAANGIPAILVPLEGLAQNHQVKNAEAAAVSGGCIVLAHRTFGENLVPTIVRLLTEPSLLRTMKEKIRTFSRLDASKKTAQTVLAVTHEHGAVA